MNLEYAIKNLTHNETEAKMVLDAMIFLPNERKRKFLNAYFTYQSKQQNDKVTVIQTEEMQNSIFSRIEYYTPMINDYVEEMKNSGKDNNQIIESLKSVGVRENIIEQFQKREALIEKNRNRKVYLKSKYNNIQK